METTTWHGTRSTRRCGVSWTARPPLTRPCRTSQPASCWWSTTTRPGVLSARPLTQPCAGSQTPRSTSRATCLQRPPWSTQRSRTGSRQRASGASRTSASTAAAARRCWAWAPRSKRWRRSSQTWRPSRHTGRQCWQRGTSWRWTQTSSCCCRTPSRWRSSWAGSLGQAAGQRSSEQQTP